MTNKQSYPKCQACPPPTATQRSESVRSSDIPQLTTRHEVEALGIGRLRNEELEHVMSEDDILAEYHVPEEDVECSYKDHPHGHGVVVRTACKAIMFLGVDCAEKYVVGFKAAQEKTNRTREFKADQANLARLSELRRKLSEQNAERAPLFTLREDGALRDEAFIKEVRRRASRESAREAEVDVPDERRPGHTQRERMEGLEFWRWKDFNPSQLPDLLQKAEALVQERGHEELSPKRARQLGRRYSEIENARLLQERMWEVADRFFSERNLRVAVFAVPGPPLSRDEAAAIVARVRSAFETAQRERDRIRAGASS